VARYELQEGEEEIMSVKPSMLKLFLLLFVTLFSIFPGSS
jgi:hypothetical protein